MDSVTKTKNEGRVAASKRLAEWNRKNKEDLLKNKAEVPTQVEQVPTTSGSQIVGSALSRAAGDHVGSAMSNFGVYGGAMLLIAGIVYYLYVKNRKAPVQAEPPKKQLKIYME